MLYATAAAIRAAAQIPRNLLIVIRIAAFEDEAAEQKQ